MRIVLSYRLSQRCDKDHPKQKPATHRSTKHLFLQSIYRAAYQGVGETLFVKIGYIQPAKVDEVAQTLSLSDDPSAEGVTDDVVGEIIELVTGCGGEAVFLP